MVLFLLKNPWYLPSGMEFPRGNSIPRVPSIPAGQYLVVFWHLMGLPALFPFLDKLFDENNLGPRTVSAKVMFSLTELESCPEALQGVVRLLGAMFETCLKRVEALVVIYDKVAVCLAKSKDDSSVVINAAFIEKAQPVGSAMYDSAVW